jgi:uroporphyrinogen decarboxylase
MRQAGRYHKHYQGLRAQHSFVELCKDPSLAAQVALGPVQDFDFDVAILFSDILFQLEALGLGLEFTDSGPKLGRQLTSIDLLKSLKHPAEAFEMLKFQGQALKATRELLPKDKSLIGFLGGPVTLFSYAVQGRHEGGLVESKKQLHSLFRPFVQDYLAPLMELCIQDQLASGAEIVMLFDTASGELDPATFRELCVPILKGLAQKFPAKLGYYSKGTQLEHLDPLLVDGQFWAGFGFDHRWNLNQVLRSDWQAGFVQGNFDQALMHLDPDTFKKVFESYCRRLLELQPQSRARWVSGLGHGVLPKTPEANVRSFVNIQRSLFVL